MDDHIEVTKGLQTGQISISELRQLIDGCCNESISKIGQVVHVTIVKYGAESDYIVSFFHSAKLIQIIVQMFHRNVIEIEYSLNRDTYHLSRGIHYFKDILSKYILAVKLMKK